MKQAFPGRSGCRAVFVTLLAFVALAGKISADQVEMQNGDRYVGRVLSLDTNVLVLQNENLGILRLARAQVAMISFGSAPANPLPSQLPAPKTNSPVDSKLITQLSANSNLIQQVQKRFLSDSGAEAQGKFNDLVGGLLSGNLTVEDIRAEAKSSADQLRAMRKDLSGEAGWALDGYLAILDHFVKQVPAGTNTPAPKSLVPLTDD